MLSESHDHYDVAQDGRGVVTLTIARSGKLNLISSSVTKALIEGLKRLGQDSSVRVLVLTGDGDRAFIGGADVKEMATLNPKTAKIFISSLHELCEAIRVFPVPVIARIQGWCLGGGLEVAAACDIRVAASTAQFGMPEVRMGIPSVIHAALLPRLIGSGRARWLMLTANLIDTSRALEWGLVDGIAESQQLDAEVERVLAALLACGPQVMRSQKRLLNTWDDVPLSEGVKVSIKEFGNAFRGEEPYYFMSEFLTRKRGT